jgi:enoyl-CoA hydratase/carnithine racemase
MRVYMFNYLHMHAPHRVTNNDIQYYSPSKRNAMNQAFWRDIVKIFDRISTDKVTP